MARGFSLIFLTVVSTRTLSMIYRKNDHKQDSWGRRRLLLLYLERRQVRPLENFRLAFGGSLGCRAVHWGGQSGSGDGSLRIKDVSRVATPYADMHAGLSFSLALENPREGKKYQPLRCQSLGCSSVPCCPQKSPMLLISLTLSHGCRWRIIGSTLPSETETGHVGSGTICIVIGIQTS